MTRARGAAGPAARLFAWTGAALFVASLVYFLYCYVIRYGAPVAPGLRPARPILIDLALFTAFALHHSVFARLPVRAWVARTLPAYLERSLYVWIASVMFIAVCALWQPVPGLLWSVSGPWRWGCLLAQAGGAWLAVRSAGVIDVFDLAGVRQLDEAPTEMAFKRSGPYGWVRHPIYAGWLLLVFGAPTMTATRFVFATVSTAYLLVAIPLEERTMRRLSAAYGDYARAVRWKLIPGVF